MNVNTRLVKGFTPGRFLPQLIASYEAADYDVERLAKIQAATRGNSERKRLAEAKEQAQVDFPSPPTGMNTIWYSGSIAPPLLY